MQKPVTAGFVDALRARDGGAIRNGTASAPTLTRTRQEATIATPVRIVREPAGPWRCDTCRRTGGGWIDIDSHFRRTGHRRYTATPTPPHPAR